MTYEREFPHCPACGGAIEGRVSREELEIAEKVVVHLGRIELHMGNKEALANENRDLREKLTVIVRILDTMGVKSESIDNLLESKPAKREEGID